MKSRIGPLLNKLTGEMTIDSIEMANILAEQYSSVFSKPSTTPPTIDDPNQSPINNIAITPHELTEAIEELKNSAASGPDGYPAILLKNCKSSLSHPLTTFWNLSMETGNIPQSLKTSIIPPIHKGGSKSEAANYRPVALTSHLIKTFEKVLRKRMTKFLDDNDKLNKNQHGFRTGRSCLTQLLAHYDNIISLLEDGQKVDHNILLRKLQQLGIQGKTLHWIQTFLGGRTQRVIVNGKLSVPHNVISGVPQGSVIGPLLFLVLIGDIDEATFLLR